MTIAEFLEARIVEDEAYAAQAQGQHYGWVDNWRAETMQGTRTESVIYAHAFRFSPERLLAECAAKREIIPHLQDFTALEALAYVYKDHPDYDKNWRR